MLHPLMGSLEVKWQADVNKAGRVLFAAAECLLVLQTMHLCLSEKLLIQLILSD